MASTVRSEKDMIEESQKKLMQSTNPLEKLRLQCLTRGCAGIKEFGRCFRIIDDDANKKISVEEFNKAIRDFNVQLSEEETKALFKQFDRDNSGSIDFDEFIVTLRPPMSETRVDIILQAFNRLDKNKNGVVTVDDLKGVYSVQHHPKFISGEATEEQILEEFLKSFEMGHHVDGKVTKEEFLNYYAGVSASIDSDVYFDQMMRKAWKM